MAIVYIIGGRPICPVDDSSPSVWTLSGPLIFTTEVTELPAFPLVAATSKALTAAGTSHAITLPSGIVAGNLLLLFFATDGDNSVTDWDGFTQIYTGEDTRDISFHIGWKIAAGSDTCTLTVSDSEEGSHICYRITGHDTSQMPEASTGSIADTSTPDPDELTPTGGAKDYLWIASEGNDHTETISAWPTNFADNQVAQAGPGSGSCGIGVCSYNLNASVLNPAAFTLSGSEQCIAVTVAVHPYVAIAFIPRIMSIT